MIGPLASLIGAPRLIGIGVAILAVGGGCLWGYVEHVKVAERDAQLQVKASEIAAAARANQTQRETIDALKAQHALELTTLKSEAEAATARAAKAEKAKTYVRSAPPSADAPLDPALRDALVSLRKSGTPAGGGDQGRAPVGP